MGGGYPGSVTTTTMATTKTSTGKSRKMYILLNTGSSNTILSDKYLGQVTSIKNFKLSMQSQEAYILLINKVL